MNSNGAWRKNRQDRHGRRKSLKAIETVSSLPRRSIGCELCFNAAVGSALRR